MNIGIDAYYLYSSKNTGVGQLNLNIISELAKIDKRNSYFLYTPGITHEGAAKDISKNPNFKIVEVPGFFHTSRRIWLQSPALRKSIMRDKINLFWGVGEYLPLMLPKNIQCITSVYDVVFKRFPETQSLVNKLFYTFLFPFSLRRSQRVITISHDSKNDIVKYLKIDENKIHTIIIGIDVKKFTPQKNYKKENYILFVGTLQPRKNLENLLKAFQVIVAKHDLNLVIVGASGWKSSGMRDVIEGMSEKVRNKIDFKGYIDDHELIDLYRKARIFAAPSLHEGFGLIILEAMASGTPVVTSPSGAIPEIFGDHVHYADPHSPEDIAEKIIELLDNRRLQKKMIDAGLNYSKNYDIRKVARKYHEMLNTFEKR